MAMDCLCSPPPNPEGILDSLEGAGAAVQPKSALELSFPAPNCSLSALNGSLLPPPVSKEILSAFAFLTRRPTGFGGLTGVGALLIEGTSDMSPSPLAFTPKAEEEDEEDGAVCKRPAAWPFVGCAALRKGEKLLIRDDADSPLDLTPASLVMPWPYWSFA